MIVDTILFFGGLAPKCLLVTRAIHLQRGRGGRQFTPKRVAYVGLLSSSFYNHRSEEVVADSLIVDSF